MSRQLKAVTTFPMYLCVPTWEDQQKSMRHLVTAILLSCVRTTTYIEYTLIARENVTALISRISKAVTGCHRCPKPKQDKILCPPTHPPEYGHAAPLEVVPRPLRPITHSTGAPAKELRYD